MSLVDYKASSDEESDADDGENNTVVNTNTEDNKTGKADKNQSNYNKQTASIEASFFNENDVVFKKEFRQIPFQHLPLPKAVTAGDDLIEDDDEFLHKKDIVPPIEKPVLNRMPVKISIPALSKFKDVAECKPKRRPDVGPSTKTYGLLNLLPKPKHEGVFSKDNSKGDNNKTVKTALIPDSVKTRQKIPTKQSQKFSQVQINKPLVPVFEGSGDSDSDDDFFSLNTKEELPEISFNEINSMVAKKAAEIAENTSKYEQSTQDKTDDDEPPLESSVVNEGGQDVKFDEKALQALVGSRAKRRKVEVNVLELSSEEVLPNKDEWLRTALAQATTYQPKGVLVDEEPAPGTRKKHQITYLAHQAKANELELQAMWSANRHTRRQTQSKYGF